MNTPKIDVEGLPDSEILHFAHGYIEKKFLNRANHYKGSKDTLYYCLASTFLSRSQVWENFY